MIVLRKWIAVGVATIAFICLAVAQGDLNPKNRKELKREDMAGTNMEVIISVIEAQPGEFTRPSHSSWRGGILCASRSNV